MPRMANSGLRPPSWSCFLFILWTLVAGGVLSSVPGNLRILRSFQTHACDGTSLNITCLSDTVISIYFAQYGRKVPYRELCSPGTRTEPNFLEKEPTDCMSEHTEALQMVQKRCQDKRICIIRTAPESFGGDPCPGVHKYVEVAYKCRPKTKLTKVTCEGDRLTLRCAKSFFIIIYSAFFAGVPEGASNTGCPRGMDMKGQKCEDPYTIDIVQNECHLKKRCTLGVNQDLFRSPRCLGNRQPLFLKVDYTCAPRDALKPADYPPDEKYGEEDGDYFVVEGEGTYLTGTPSIYPGEELEYAIKTGKPNRHVPSDPGWTSDPNSDMQSDEITNDGAADVNCTTLDGHKTVGLVTEWISAYKFISDNREKFILYLTLSVGMGLVAFFVVLSGRLFWQNRKRRQAEEVKVPEPIENAMEAEFCELDQPDLRGDHERRTVPVSYANCHSLQRPVSNTFPRTPVNQDIANHYYS